MIALFDGNIEKDAEETEHAVAVPLLVPDEILDQPSRYFILLLCYRNPIDCTAAIRVIAVHPFVEILDGESSADRIARPCSPEGVHSFKALIEAD